MTEPNQLPRDVLYQNWLGWVTEHLGGDPKFATIAASAAVDAVVSGDGFNAATRTAMTAWIQAAADDKPLWRPGFWSLLFTQFYVWGLLILLFTIPFYRIAPQMSLFAILIPPALIAAGWKVYVCWRLSKRGIAVPGSLFNVTEKDSDGTVYKATYAYEFDGQHLISRLTRQLPTEVVLILFDPKHPRFAMVMSEYLNRGGLSGWPRAVNPWHPGA
jgi:hypothetical protein